MLEVQGVAETEVGPHDIVGRRGCGGRDGASGTAPAAPAAATTTGGRPRRRRAFASGGLRRRGTGVADPGPWGDASTGRGRRRAGVEQIRLGRRAVSEARVLLGRGRDVVGRQPPVGGGVGPLAGVVLRLGLDRGRGAGALGTRRGRRSLAPVATAT